MHLFICEGENLKYGKHNYFVEITERRKTHRKTKEGLIAFPDRKFTNACAGIVTNVTVTHEKPNYCFICGDMLESNELTWPQIHEYVINNKLVLKDVKHGSFSPCKFTILVEARDMDYVRTYKVLGVINGDISELFLYEYVTS